MTDDLCDLLTLLVAASAGGIVFALLLGSGDFATLFLVCFLAAAACKAALHRLRSGI